MRRGRFQGACSKVSSARKMVAGAPIGGSGARRKLRRARGMGIAHAPARYLGRVEGYRRREREGLRAVSLE